MALEVGYLIEVESWENDADNWFTVSVSGKSKSAAYVASKLLPLFESSDWQGGLGNAYQGLPDGYHERLFEKYKKSPKKWHDAFDKGGSVIQTLTEFKDSKVLYGANDLLRELGVLFKGEFTTRVVNSYDITYIEKPVVSSSVSFYDDDDDDDDDIDD